MPLFRPGKPRIHLGLLANAAGVASGVPLTWTDVVSQEGDGWDPLTPTLYTITRNALWLIAFGVFSDTGSATSSFGIELLLNGTMVARIYNPSITALHDRGEVITYLADLVAGDTVSGQITLSAGTRVVNSQGTYLQATRVGPERWTG